MSGTGNLGCELLNFGDVGNRSVWRLVFGKRFVSFFTYSNAMRALSGGRSTLVRGKETLRCSALSCPFFVYGKNLRTRLSGWPAVVDVVV